MRGHVAAGAVVAALAVGGLPGLALSMAADHATTGTTAVAKADDAGTPGWMTKPQKVPPGWARHHDGAQPHGFAMRAWAHCVSQARPHGRSNGSERAKACGERPSPPGLARR